MEHSTFLEEIRIWEHAPWYGTTQTEEKNKIFFEENQKGLLQLHDKTHHCMMVKPRAIFGLSQEISFDVIMWNPESNFTRRLKNHSLFHWNTSTLPELPILLQMWCPRNILTITGTLMATENCQMRGQVFTRFIVLIENPLDGYTWFVWILTRKQTTSRPNTVWPDLWKHMSDASKRKEKLKWAIEKPKLDNARRLRGIFFIEPDYEEFKRTMKKARRKLEIPMPAAMPSRIQLHQHWETCGTVGQRKTRYACIVEADESMRIRMERSQSKNHQHQQHEGARRSWRRSVFLVEACPLSGLSFPRDWPSSSSGSFGWSCSKQVQSLRPAFQHSGNSCPQLIATTSVPPLNRTFLPLWSITFPPRENQNK